MLPGFNVPPVVIAANPPLGRLRPESSLEFEGSFSREPWVRRGVLPGEATSFSELWSNAGFLWYCRSASLGVLLASESSPSLPPGGSKISLTRLAWSGGSLLSFLLSSGFSGYGYSWERCSMGSLLVLAILVISSSSTQSHCFPLSIS